jgi:Subtilisin inhibitor-like
MRRLVGIAICALVLAAVGAALGASPPTASVRGTYWADSAKPDASVVWTLRCDPPGGSLPQPKRACERIASGGAKLFAPVPRGIACTQIYGGPQKARVVGTVLGTRVWATFTRTDGCQIGRWQRLSPWLLPAGGVP